LLKPSRTASSCAAVVIKIGSFAESPGVAHTPNGAKLNARIIVVVNNILFKLYNFSFRIIFLVRHYTKSKKKAEEQFDMLPHPYIANCYFI
jgi:hypothetical protein